MTTLSQIVSRSARALGYLGRNITLTAADLNDGVDIFNTMLDSWSNEKLYSYVVLERSFTLQVGKAQYSIGASGADVTAVRPFDITQAYIQDSGSNNFLMRVLTRDKWNQIGNRGATITSQIPTDLFYDPQYPNGVINIFPAPLAAYALYYDTTQNQVDPASITTQISMPLGYERAYITNLALELMANGFPCLLDDKQLVTLRESASESKANIKRTNIKEVVADYDPAIVSRSYATYNIYSDGRNGAF